MPNINGDGFDNDIVVDNDTGNIDGGPDISPVNHVRGRGGDDTITITDSDITGRIAGGGGADEISVTGGSVAGRIAGGGGGDTVSLFQTSVGTAGNPQNVSLGGGNDSLDIVDTDVSGVIDGGNGTDALNLPVGTIVTDSDPLIGTFTILDTTTVYAVTSGTFTLPSGQTLTYSNFENGTGIPCFTRGTLIKTARGDQNVEDLQQGDLIWTEDSGLRPLRWIGRRKISAGERAQNPKLHPVRITAGALGNGLPERDMLVSRQHRMLVQSRIAERMFGRRDILVAAIKLCQLPGIYVDETVENVEYIHLLFDQHEIIFAENTPTESLFTGPEALKAVSKAAREEIFTLFPEIAEPDFLPEPARLIPDGARLKQLVTRHRKNNKPVLGLG